MQSSRIIFEKTEQELSDKRIAELAKKAANSFVKKLGLKNKVYIHESEILTNKDNAMDYFGGMFFADRVFPMGEQIDNLVEILTGKKPELKIPELTTWQKLKYFFTREQPKPELANGLSVFGKYIDEEQAFFSPFSKGTNNGVIYSPLIEDRNKQFEYWIYPLFGFLEQIIIKMGESAISRKTTIDKEEYRLMNRYINHERQDHPKRLIRKEDRSNWYFQGKDIPIDTFTLKNLVEMGVCKYMNDYYRAEESFLTYVKILANVHEGNEALPPITKHFTIFDFPKKWINDYRKSMLANRFVIGKKTENITKGEDLLYRVSRHVNNNPIDAFAVTGEAIRQGKTTYDSMVSYVSSKTG
ncbi:hypothetical protein GF323_01350 [Candidatus Woesearchaeota archaeon]|nr:hypothetical protein [Candidatus Woesearchaeota archaeon]